MARKRNSPYEQIQVYWPNDQSPFTIKKDLRLFKANYAAGYIYIYIYGANIWVPEELLHQDVAESDLPVEGEEFMKAYREQETAGAAGEASADAFQPVRDLFAERTGLISSDDYDRMKVHQSRVRTKVSIREDENDWIFVHMQEHQLKHLPPQKKRA